MIALEANTEKAIKLDEAIDAGQSNDTTSITPALSSETVLEITLACFKISANARSK
jgi:hypothetical protein